MGPGAMKTTFRACLLLSGVLLGAPLATAASPPSAPMETFASALAHVSEAVDTIRAKSRELAKARAAANRHLQIASTALHKLQAGSATASDVEIHATRDELQIALEAFELVRTDAARRHLLELAAFEQAHVPRLPRPRQLTRSERS